MKINSITQCLKPGVDCSLYVDDFQICYRSSNMSIIERQLQLCLNKLQQWATDNGFRFSKTKTLCMHICQKRGLHLDPQLCLDKSPDSGCGGGYPLFPISNMLKEGFEGPEHLKSYILRYRMGSRPKGHAPTLQIFNQI